MTFNINEQYADFVLSTVETGLKDLVSEIKLDDDRENLIFKIEPSLTKQFSRKFPEADLKDLDSIVEWIIIRSLIKNNDQYS